MKLFQPLLLALSMASLALLGACGNGASTIGSTPVATTAKADAELPKASSSPSMAKPEAKNDKSRQGGQVVESGIYHMELVPKKEENAIYLDFFLEKGDNHEVIPNAKVTAQVQLPDGTQKNLELKYDSSGKHYTVMLPSKAAGEYKVVVLSDISGEKVNGRFSFKQ